MSRLLICLLCVVASGCSLFSEDDTDLGTFSDYEAYLEEREDLLAELDREIGEARASDIVACAVVAIGEKACGGPTGYRVYSTEASDVSEINRLAEAIAAMDRQANRQFELASTCDVPVEPTVALVGGQCRVGDGVPSAD
ncbi:hypothetical protein [Rubrivirga sp.]|uniref:hypothetical protein n=1 Tax=Rubrivirga sp. TaxID=1885344 RepID=UPI003B51AD96